MTSRLHLFTGALLLAIAPLAWAASDAPCKRQPDDVFQGMSAKLVRGIVNLATCPAEMPKQCYRTTRDLGVPGAFIGFFKGMGMVAYRGVTGALETVLFLVPEPGFYESLTTPAFVWQGWREATPPVPREGTACR